MPDLTHDQEEHLDHIKDEFDELYDLKYRKGAEEHGGNLAKVSVRKLLEMKLEESMDSVGYDVTAIDTVEDIITILEECHCGCRHCIEALELLK